MMNRYGCVCIVCVCVFETTTTAKQKNEGNKRRFSAKKEYSFNDVISRREREIRELK